MRKSLEGFQLLANGGCMFRVGTIILPITCNYSNGCLKRQDILLIYSRITIWDTIKSHVAFSTDKQKHWCYAIAADFVFRIIGAGKSDLEIKCLTFQTGKTVKHLSLGREVGRVRVHVCYGTAGSAPEKRYCNASAGFLQPHSSPQGYSKSMDYLLCT